MFVEISEGQEVFADKGGLLRVWSGVSRINDETDWWKFCKLLCLKFFLHFAKRLRIDKNEGTLPNNFWWLIDYYYYLFGIKTHTK